MHLDLTAEQHSLRKQLRSYYRDLFTPELRAALNAEWDDMGGSVFRQIVARMGADGWLGIGWPKEYGGQGRGPLEQLIFWEETYRARAPLPIIAVNTIGPTVIRYGTDEQKQALLPGILRGELHFGVGYTEPSAGTDLASLTTRAVRDGDEYVINGSKVYTSLADFSDYIWLAARTNADAPKHRGISIFMVSTRLPGFKLTPIQTMGGVRTNATYYEDMRVPASCLIGKENEGWSLIVNQLNHERVSLSPHGSIEHLFQEARAWTQETKLADGRRVIDQPFVQANLAKVHAKLEVLKLMNWKQAWSMTRGSLHPAEASATKVFATEFYVEAYRLLLELFGARGTLRPGSSDAVLRGRVERMYRTTLILTFGGGTNEVQREIIAAAGLQMPRGR